MVQILSTILQSAYIYITLPYGSGKRETALQKEEINYCKLP